MNTPRDYASGKGNTDENFPVASILIQPRHREIVLAFYKFARTADDVADNQRAGADEKLRVLECMRTSLLGEDSAVEESVALRELLAERKLSNVHALDLLEAFRRDVSKLRYATWAELMEYCRFSAMPVGRFVLDVHGESPAVWPESDALCAALQVINHLQDCGKDYRHLDRVYLPLDMLSAAGVEVRELGSRSASPGLLSAIRGLARETATLLGRSKSFSAHIADRRLAMEVSVIQALAEDLNLRLMERDPLLDRVHHRKNELFGIAARAIAGFARQRASSHPLLRKLVGQP